MSIKVVAEHTIFSDSNTISSIALGALPRAHRLSVPQFPPCKMGITVPTSWSEELLIYYNHNHLEQCLAYSNTNSDYRKKKEQFTS